MPKSSRTVSCNLLNSDFEKLSSEFITQCITNKLLFFYQNPKFDTFQNFSEFMNRCDSKLYEWGSNETSLGYILSPLK